MDLEQQGKIQGVLDDRGKYVYVTREEMESLGLFIRQKGRVNMQEIVKEFNRIIDLEIHSPVHLK